MKLLKIFFPKDKAQEVNEVESFTLKWQIQGDRYGSYITKHKVFLNIDDAEKYKKELMAAAKFLGTWVCTEITKN